MSAASSDDVPINVIGKAMASVYRKELALGKIVNNDASRDMTPEEREIRTQKLAVYDASIKVAGKRTCLRKCSMQLNSIGETAKKIQENTAERGRQVCQFLMSLSQPKGTPHR